MKIKQLAKAVVQQKLGRTLEEKVRARLGKAYSKGQLNESKDHSFPPGTLDQSMAAPRWKDHHPEVFHGLHPGQNMAPKEEGATKYIHFASDSTRPKAVLKAPLDWKELKVGPEEDKTPESHSHFMNPGFRSTHREAAFHLLSNKVFGLDDFVPKTTVFKHPRTQDPWSAMQFVPHAERLTHPDQLHRYNNTDKLHRLAFMDSILGNNDRHGGNILVDKTGGMHLIDNAGSFDYSHKFQTPIPKYAQHLQNKNVPESVHKWLQNLSEANLAHHMTAAGAPHELTQVALKRLSEAKRWSRVVSGNPGATKQLGGALQVVQSHRLGQDPLMEDARRTTYNQIKHGESVATPQVSAEDKTQIHRR
jgi:hypothetical protein